MMLTKKGRKVNRIIRLSVIDWFELENPNMPKPVFNPWPEILRRQTAKVLGERPTVKSVRMKLEKVLEEVEG